MTPQVTACGSVRDIYHLLDPLQLNPRPKFGEAQTHEPEPHSTKGDENNTFPASLAAWAQECEQGSTIQILPPQTWHQKLACKTAGTLQTLF